MWINMNIKYSYVYHNIDQLDRLDLLVYTTV